MQLVETYSHLNGLEYLMVHRKKLWEEIQQVIAEVDAEACLTKVSKEKTMAGKKLYSPIDMNKLYKKLFEQHGWNEERVNYYVSADPDISRDTLTLVPQRQRELIIAAGKTPLLSYNQTDFVKDRVAVEVQFGKYAFVAYDLFVKHMAFYVGNKVDVGVEILPMKSLQSEMSSGVGYYEGELYNVIRQGRGTPAVPLVIIGVAP